MCETLISNLVLGTAKWGSEIDRESAFSILEFYLESGGIWIDTATNYPINKRENDLGLSLRIISEWLGLNPGVQINVFCKIGSTNNSGSASSNLTPAKMKYDLAQLELILEQNLKGIGIHWDNRGPEEIEQVAETLVQMQSFHTNGYSIGFSGVANPNLYAKLAPELKGKWVIQVKESLGDSSPRKIYLEHFPNAQFLAYGISGKSTVAKVSSDELIVQEFNDLLSSQNLTYAEKIAFLIKRRGVDKVIIGPRNLTQLKQTIKHIDLCD